MRHTKAEIYLHFVWATEKREPLLIPEVERSVYHCIQNEAVRLRCVVMAMGGMPDHVHLLVRVPTRVSAASLANQVKGVSSHFVHQQLKGLEHFQWQEGYGVFSISRSHVRRVAAYVKNQKLHHTNSTLWPEWEETDEETVLD